MRMTQMQFRLSNYQFRPSWLGLAILIICVPLFIKLGLWQYSKAQMKQDIQTKYDASLDSSASSLPETLGNLDSWRYKKVKVIGHYETQYQILLDNQVENDQVGFHVVTPFKIAGRNDYVLINRGWVAGGNTHNETPKIETPGGQVEVMGLAWVPSKKIFTLETDAQKNTWNQIWQNMDMDRYQKSVPIHVLPLVIKMDAKSNAGGFVRNWQLPASRIATNIGYAYQWFGFAAASILIFLYTSIKKVSNDSKI